MVSSLHNVQCSSLRAVVVSASGEIYTAVTITEENSFGRYYGLHLIVQYSNFSKITNLIYVYIFISPLFNQVS